MTRSIISALLLLFGCLPADAAVPSPRQHFGFTPGDDFQLADYGEIIAYFRKLDEASERMRLVEFGRSELGKPMYVALLSSEANLRQLERFQQISRRLALGLATEPEAKALSREGKVVVWIDSGLHATEVAPAQHAPELAYRMVSGEDEETRAIREKVILLQVPVINPDGLDWVAHWYRNNVGTPYELAPLPHLYHKYAGHDNNRDWFMMNLAETRHVSRMFYQEWFPQIIYNQHQSPAFPARMFTPPYAEPLNPNIPAAVIEGTNLIGMAIRERLARRNMAGVISYHGYDAWWNGGLRTAPFFHNMHGILTETALFRYATPRVYKPSELPERFGNGIPTRESTIFYPLPWLGGRWGVRDAIEYMLTADMAILELAASRAEHFLYKAWEMARQQVEKGRQGSPYAYIVPKQQWDFSSALEMLRRLRMSGIQVQRAVSSFTAGGRTYPAGTYVLPAAQPFRAYLLDLMEPQKYPELRSGSSGPTKRPYDMAGWTLSMNMGVEAVRVDEPFPANLEEVTEIPSPGRSLNLRENAAFRTLADLLGQGRKVRWNRSGRLLVEGESPEKDFGNAEGEYGRPRVALYEPYTANIDAGWTQWLLDYYRIPHHLLKNAEVRAGRLRERFDSIILAHQSTASILHGIREGEASGGGRNPDGNAVQQRPEYTGGIGVEGLAALEVFVRQGGTLIAFDDATDLPVQFFPLPVRGLSTSGAGRDATQGGFYAPGSLIRISVDTAHPLAAGMPGQAYAFTTGGKAWDITLLPEHNRGEREVRPVARYAQSKLLASGWVSGERAVAGRCILVDARHGSGRVVLFGFRPQFRGQSFGTFKFVLNAIYRASARELVGAKAPATR